MKITALDSLPGRLWSRVSISTISSLQLFQLTRYSSFVLIGISFARMGISRVEISRFESFRWLMGLFSFFLIAGLMNSMLALYPSRSEQSRPQLLFTAFCLLLLLSAATGFIQLFVPGGSALGFVYLILNNCSFLVEYILYLNHQRKKLLIYGIAVAIIQVILCIVPAYIYRDTRIALYGLLAVAFLKFIYIVVLLKEHFISEPSPHAAEATTYRPFYYPSRDLGISIRKLFLLSLPLMAGFFVNGSAEFIDGAVVKHYFAVADFSLFVYGSRDFPIFTILAATLSMSLIPHIAEDLQAGMDTIRRKSLRYMHFFFPLAIVLILSARWLFTHVFSPQFAASGDIFAALMLLTIPRMVFPQTILTGLRENRLLLVVAVSEMLVNIVASVLLARSFGLIGVAMGTVVAFVAEKIMMMSVLYYKHNIPPGRYIRLLPYALYSAATIAAYLLSLVL